MSRNATAIATAWTAATPHGPGMARNAGSSRRAITGSPSQPSARLAKVIPTWAAASESSKCSTAWSRARAPNFDCFTSSSTRVQRTLTSANSAATKSAFKPTNRGTESSRDGSSRECHMEGAKAGSGLLDLAAALERATQRDQVRVLEVRAHRHAARDARDPHAEGRKQLREVERRGLARHVGIGGEDHFLDLA